LGLWTIQKIFYRYSHVRTFVTTNKIKNNLVYAKLIKDSLIIFINLTVSERHFKFFTMIFLLAEGLSSSVSDTSGEWYAELSFIG
jgi:hypothetical protein